MFNVEVPTSAKKGAVRAKKGAVKPFTDKYLTAESFAVCPNKGDFYEVTKEQDSEIKGIYTKITSLDLGTRIGTARLRPLGVGGAFLKTLPCSIINSATQITKEVNGVVLFSWWNHTAKKEVFEVEIPTDYKADADYSHLAPTDCYPNFRKMVVESDARLLADNKVFSDTLEVCMEKLAAISGDRTAQSWVGKAMVLAGVGAAPTRVLAEPADLGF